MMIKNLLSYLDEFTDIYINKPIQNNVGGMGFNHSFIFYTLLKNLKPNLVIESGVWKGLSTYIVESALPEAEIVCLDLSFNNLEYKSKKATYKEIDFNCIDWSKYNVENSLCFFDDHQNSLERLKEMKWWGFKNCIFEDNYPPNEGDFYSMKQALSSSGHPQIQMSDDFKPKKIKYRFKRIIEEKALNKYYYRQNMIVKPNKIDSEGIKKNIIVYQEYPPVMSNASNIWNKEWAGDYEKKNDLINSENIDKFPIFKKYISSLNAESFKKNFEYGFITYVEIK